MLKGSNQSGESSQQSLPAANLLEMTQVPVADMTSTPSRKEPIFLADDAMYSKEHFLIPNHYIDYVDSVLIPQGLISDRIEKLAQDIRAAYQGQTIHLLCVLKGGSAFFHALIEKLRMFHKYNTCEYVPFTFDFIKVKSYDGLHSTGNVQVSGADLTKFKGKHLLLVEDIIDTGKTMAKLVPYLHESEPASVKVASLLEKRNPESCGFLGNFVGFSIPDKFVIGCCLDYNEIFRDLDHICIINSAGIAKWAHH
ncbi:hypoxanthine phosphoribosyltransferase [Aphanomyces invadans]|uniref:Hypoxanthine phosphoribosyltransferase n=1 Tax=Aphanomyces invadans TaxID=157072 RepID=A0A024TSJ4_9STRA|nr:hypoxanthine phosphoribosyltransferase [Aphanomyces invadans]ETV96988.1 hypoxanthine phosphoribosyltransferase [Aphanomyces invadans]|eukprot:XP_008874234.1 hypoxanthine phosphoribosyltransferase [Aphanomyces invadans]